MKRVLIIYAIFFALTIIIPALVCFSPEHQESKNELMHIFSSMINLIGCYR